MPLLGGNIGGSGPSATQSTQTASGSGQIFSGGQTRYSAPGSINVGGNQARYLESGSADLTNSKGAVLGSSYSATGNGTLNVQNLDPQVVTDALNTVAAIQKQSADQASANQSALQAATDNLNKLLGLPGSTLPGSSSPWTSYFTWGGGGLLVILLLVWLFHRKKP
jgi:hypothetical protein